MLRVCGCHSMFDSADDESGCDDFGGGDEDDKDDDS